MPANALLCRWSGGWHEVSDPASIAAHGRAEALLELGAAQSIPEVETVARPQLAIYADPRLAIAVEIEPASATDTPYLGFGLGDRITAIDPASGTGSPERVMAMTVSEDDDGHPTYAIELRDIILDAQERTAQAIKKMINGTMRGDSKVATPVAELSSVGATPNCCPPAAPPGWALASSVIPHWDTGGTIDTNRFIDDSDHDPMTLTVSGTLIGGNPVRVALVQSGEGPMPVGPVIFFRGGSVTQTFGAHLYAGTDYWFHAQEWDEGAGDPVFENFSASIAVNGSHPDVILPWDGFS